MFDYPSKSEIEIISMDLLKQSKSIDVFPTPVNSLVQFADLRIDNNVDLSKIDNSYLGLISEEAAKKVLESLSQVRGLLDRNDKTIYLDQTLLQSRQSFVKLHETGHEVLYWQKEILAYVDDDKTLDLSIKDEFEAEANYFASTILFQNDRFENKMSKLKLGIQAPMDLAKHFGSSNHAAMRKYVECSERRCALLVLEDVSKMGEFPICCKRDFFQSHLFDQTFGTIDFPAKFGYKWNFVKDYYHGKKFHRNGMITLDTENGNADFKYHFFNNSYNAFVLLFPIGEDNNKRV